MKDRIDQVDPTFVEGSAASPIGLSAPSLEQNSQDIEILFGNDLQIKPKYQNQKLNLLKKRQMHEREPAVIVEEKVVNNRKSQVIANMRIYRDNKSKE